MLDSLLNRFKERIKIDRIIMKNSQGEETLITEPDTILERYSE